MDVSLLTHLSAISKAATLKEALTAYISTILCIRECCISALRPVLRPVRHQYTGWLGLSWRHGAAFRVAS